jgi:hypothetical protein
VRSLILILGLIVPSLGLAETWYTLGFTKHAEDKNYCEVHPGITYDWRFSTVRTYLGAYQNSHCQASGQAGVAWLPLSYRRLSAGVTAMALTGYERQFLLAASPVLTYEEKKHGVDIVGWPGIILHVRYRFAF